MSASLNFCERIYFLDAWKKRKVINIIKNLGLSFKEDKEDGSAYVIATSFKMAVSLICKGGILCSDDEVLEELINIECSKIKARQDLKRKFRYTQESKPLEWHKITNFLIQKMKARGFEFNKSNSSEAIYFTKVLNKDFDVVNIRIAKHNAKTWNSQGLDYSFVIKYPDFKYTCDDEIMKECEEYAPTNIKSLLSIYNQILAKADEVLLSNNHKLFN